MADISFQVSMPTDEGFVGRECANPDCSKYFRVHMDSFSDEMHCRYCGERFDRDELLTSDQLAYLQEAAREKAMEYASAEIAKMFGQMRSSKYVSFKAGKPYKARPVIPSYEERKVDSEIICPACETRFQVDGIFAHCVGCGVENIAVFDANLEVIRREVAAAGNSQRVLRHAYNDLVSTFENVCSRRSVTFADAHNSFQDPYEARRFFKKHAAVDLIAGLDADQELAVRRVFHKRHSWQHARGIVNDRYVKKVPEDRDLLGIEALLSMDELETAATGVRLMLDALPSPT